MHQTKPFVSQANGLNFDIEPKVIIKPIGSAISNVATKSKQFSEKPFNKSTETVLNVSNIYKTPKSYLVTITCLFSI